MENKENIQKLVKDLYKYSYGRLNSKEQAEDVTSETITRLIEKMSAKTYSTEQGRMLAFGIAKNVLFEKYREEIKISHDEINEELNLNEDESLEETVMKDEMIDLIKSELNTLDSATKEILTLKIWEDLKFKEIADLHNTNENTIKTIYYKGLTSLKKQLEVKHGSKAYSFTVPSIILGLSLYGDAIAAQINPGFMAGVVSTIPASLFFMFSNMASPIAAAGATAVSATHKGVLAKFISTTIGKVIVGTVATTVAVGGGVGGAVLVKNNIDNTNQDPVSYSQSDYELGQDDVEISDPVEELETKEVTFCIDNYRTQPPNCNTEITAQVPLDAVITTPEAEGSGPVTPSATATISGAGYTFGIVAPYETFTQEFKSAKEIKQGLFRVESKNPLASPYLYSSSDELKNQSTCQSFGETLAYPCGLSVVSYSDYVGLIFSCKEVEAVNICDEIVKNLIAKEKTGNTEEKTVVLDSAEWFGTFKVSVTLPVEKGSIVSQPNPNDAFGSLQKTSAVIENNQYKISMALPYEGWHTYYTSTHSLGLTANGEIYRVTTETSAAGSYIYTNDIRLQMQCGQAETFIVEPPCGSGRVLIGEKAFGLACEEKVAGGLAKCEEAIKRMKVSVL